MLFVWEKKYDDKINIIKIQKIKYNILLYINLSCLYLYIILAYFYWQKLK